MPGISITSLGTDLPLPDLCRPDRTDWPFKAPDDRCDTSQGAPNIGVPAQQGPFLRHIGRTKGGMNTKLMPLPMRTVVL